MMDPNSNTLRPADEMPDVLRKLAQEQQWGTWREGEEIALRGHIFRVQAIESDSLTLVPVRPTKKMLKRLGQR